jgi:hypothetical protein
MDLTPVKFLVRVGDKTLICNNSIGSLIVPSFVLLDEKGIWIESKPSEASLFDSVKDAQAFIDAQPSEKRSEFKIIADTDAMIFKLSLPTLNFSDETQKRVVGAIGQFIGCESKCFRICDVCGIELKENTIPFKSANCLGGHHYDWCDEHEDPEFCPFCKK